MSTNQIDVNAVNSRVDYVIDAIKLYKKQHNRVPNLQVLAEILDKHPNTIRHHVDRLIAKGLLTKVKREQEGHYDICG